jgi:Zn-dependent peptidase ImmA (M78 family)
MMDLLFCEQDRDRLLAAVAPGVSVLPADVLDDLIEDVLGLGLVTRPMPDAKLGVTHYDRRCITINSRMSELVRPNTNMEGLLHSTKAHELAHMRLPHHEVEVRAARRQGHFLDPAVEARQEEEANFYAGVFLVPTLSLWAKPRVLQLLEADPAAWTSDALWQTVLDLARSFRVTGSLMARRLIHIGVIEKNERLLNLPLFRPSPAPPAGA